MCNYKRHPKCKFGVGYKQNKSNKPNQPNGMKLTKDNLPIVRFVKNSSTNNEADNVIKPELKYVSPTESEKWLHFERRKANRTEDKRNETSTSQSQKHSPPLYKAFLRKDQEVKPIIIKTNTGKVI